jgi:hypothetical protein
MSHGMCRFCKRGDEAGRMLKYAARKPSRIPTSGSDSELTIKAMTEALARGPKSQKAHLELVEKWKHVPKGTPVVVTRDDGSEFKTKTRSIPWMLGASCRSGGHTAVILVEGLSGGYGLWRVRLDTDRLPTGI